MCRICFGHQPSSSVFAHLQLSRLWYFRTNASIAADFALPFFYLRFCVGLHPMCRFSLSVSRFHHGVHYCFIHMLAIATKFISAAVSPFRLFPVLGQAEAVLGLSVSVLGQAEAVLGLSVSVLGQAEAVLGLSVSVLGQAEQKLIQNSVFRLVDACSKLRRDFQVLAKTETWALEQQ